MKDRELARIHIIIALCLESVESLDRRLHALKNTVNELSSQELPL